MSSASLVVLVEAEKKKMTIEHCGHNMLIHSVVKDLLKFGLFLHIRNDVEYYS